MQVEETPLKEMKTLATHEDKGANQEGNLEGEGGRQKGGCNFIRSYLTCDWQCGYLRLQLKLYRILEIVSLYLNDHERVVNCMLPLTAFQL